LWYIQSAKLCVLVVKNTFADKFLDTQPFLIYAIIKTTSVGDARLSVVGAAGWAWLTHATV